MIEMYNERTIIVFNRRIPLDADIIILFVALVVYLTCAVFSIGYLHPDEHYQIIEFAKWKLQETTPQAIAWEHAAMIRPTLQPVLAMEIIRLCKWMGMANPFYQAMVMRIITSIIMLFSMRLFVKAAGRWLNPQYRNALLAATLFFWIVPMISVHFSSEVLSTACLLLLLSGLLKKGQPALSDALWMGIVAALGFEFRYQMAFAFIGIFLWILIIGKYRWQVWCIAAMGFLGVTALCTALDCWFYGKFVFTPYNYYYMNIIRHVAASFGESQWYTYLLLMGLAPGLALGIPIVLSVCIGTFKHYRHPVVWAFWAFLLVHSTIGHKELRFMFPLMPLLPLFAVWAYEMISYKQIRHIIFVVIVLLALVNVAGLVHAVFKPAAYGNVAMMQYLTKRVTMQKNLRIKVSRGSNPFRTGPLIAQFYLCQPVDIGEDGEDDNDIDLVVLWCADTKNRKRILKKGYREVYRSIPQWHDILSSYFLTYHPGMVLIAYEKKQTNL